MQAGIADTAEARQQTLDTLQRLRDLHQRQQDVYRTYRDLEDSAPYVQPTVDLPVTFCLPPQASAWLAGNHMLDMHGTDLQAETGPVRAHIEVCGGIGMLAEIPSTSRICVDVGLGFSVECEPEDVMRIARLRQAAAQVTVCALLHACHARRCPNMGRCMHAGQDAGVRRHTRAAPGHVAAGDEACSAAALSRWIDSPGNTLT